MCTAFLMTEEQPLLKNTFNRTPFLYTEFSPWSAVWEEDFTHMQWFIQMAAYTPNSQSYMPVLKYIIRQKHINLSPLQHLFMCKHVLQGVNKVYPQKGGKPRRWESAAIIIHEWKKYNSWVWYAPKHLYVSSAGMGCAVDGKCRRLACPSYISLISLVVLKKTQLTKQKNPKTFIRETKADST